MKQEVVSHSGNYEVQIHSKTRTWHDNNMQHSLQKHMVRKHYYNVRYLTNMLKIRSRGFDRAQYCNAIKFSKQIANSFAKITNGQRFLEVIRDELSNI